MKRWEVDVEMRVRRTLVFYAPLEGEQLRNWAAIMAAIGSPGVAQFLKWSDGRQVHRPMPVETTIDNDPLVVAVREVPG